ncbi:unnamed protein product, partial [Heterotrigona itama]
MHALFQSRRFNAGVLDLMGKNNNTAEKNMRLQYALLKDTLLMRRSNDPQPIRGAFGKRQYPWKDIRQKSTGIVKLPYRLIQGQT